MRNCKNKDEIESETMVFSAITINKLGYKYLDKKKSLKAIEIFKLYVEAYPEDANAYDSLAEAYLSDGDWKMAIRYFLKSLAFDPGNNNAIGHLNHLGVEVKTW